MPDNFAPDRASAYNTGLMDTENAEKTSQGLVVLVGAGPGEAKLITVAGAEWLSRADVVVYDNLASLDLLKACRPGAEKIYAGKRPGQPSMSQRKITPLSVAIRISSSSSESRSTASGDAYEYGTP